MGCSRHQGRYRYEFWRNGIRYRKAGFRTKREAQAAMAEAKKDAAQIKTAFTEICWRRLQDIKLRRSKKHHQENKKLIDNLKVIWAYKVKITKKDVKDYLDKVAEESNAKANKQMRLIKAIFNFGIKLDIIDYNPVKGLEPYSQKKKPRYIPPEEDIKKVLNVSDPKDRLYLLVIIHTLGRISSVNQLKWEHVHDSYLSLYTRKAKNSDEKEIKVPLNQVLMETLARIERNGDYVFINPVTNKPYLYRSKLMRKLCKKADVPYFSFHAFRHFGASKLDNMGVGLTSIRDLLGHSRSTTTDWYLQSLRGSTIEAVKKLEDIK